jgi:hypothetical protein
MDSNTFECEKIYEIFKREWITSPNFNSISSWKLFIQYLDLGIECTSVRIFQNDEYKIVDEKKWTINKIKYGF